MLSCSSKTTKLDAQTSSQTPGPDHIAGRTGYGLRWWAVLARGAVLAMLLATLAGCSPRQTQSKPNLPPARPEQTSEKPAEGGAESAEVPKSTVVRITTEKGDIVLELFDEQAPITAGSFLLLVKSGFYDGLVFHRVVPDFVIQGGDPLGNGAGGPGFTIPDEFDPDLHHDRGILSMAKAGPNTGGSQFFICLGGPGMVGQLDMRHSVFGKVIEGMDVVDSIRPGDKMVKVEVEQESPHVAAAEQAAKQARVPK